jgi:hypothetical protein
VRFLEGRAAFGEEIRVVVDAEKGEEIVVPCRQQDF